MTTKHQERAMDILKAFMSSCGLETMDELRTFSRTAFRDLKKPGMYVDVEGIRSSELNDAQKMLLAYIAGSAEEANVGKVHVEDWVNTRTAEDALQGAHLGVLLLGNSFESMFTSARIFSLASDLAAKLDPANSKEGYDKIFRMYNKLLSGSERFMFAFRLGAELEKRRQALNNVTTKRGDMRKTTGFPQSPLP